MVLLALALAAAAHDPATVADFSGPPAPENLQPAEGRPPMIGLDGPTTDGCSGVGRVGGFPDGAMLRSGPSDKTAEAEMLEPRTLVWLCEADGEWQGVVYASGDFQELGDCRVGTPRAEPEAYSGPCKHGWIRARSVQLLAG